MNDSTTNANTSGQTLGDERQYNTIVSIAKDLDLEIPHLEDYQAWRLSSLIPYDRCMALISSELERCFMELDSAALAGRKLHKAVKEHAQHVTNADEASVFAKWASREVLSTTSEYHLAANSLKKPLMAILDHLEFRGGRMNTLSEMRASRALLQVRHTDDDLQILRTKYHEMHSQAARERAMLKRKRAELASTRWSLLAERTLRREAGRRAARILVAERVKRYRIQHRVHDSQEATMTTGEAKGRREALGRFLTPAELDNIGDGTDSDSVESAVTPLHPNRAPHTSDLTHVRRDAAALVADATSQASMLEALSTRVDRAKADLSSQREARAGTMASLRDRETQLAELGLTRHGSIDTDEETVLRGRVLQLKRRLAHESNRIKTAAQVLDEAAKKRASALAEAELSLNSATDSLSYLGTWSRFKSIVPDPEHTVYDTDHAPDTPGDDDMGDHLLPTPNLEFPDPSSAKDIISRLDSSIKSVKSLYRSDARGGPRRRESDAQTDVVVTRESICMTEPIPRLTLPVSRLSQVVEESGRHDGPSPTLSDMSTERIERGGLGGPARPGLTIPSEKTDACMQTGLDGESAGPQSPRAALMRLISADIRGLPGVDGMSLADLAALLEAGLEARAAQQYGTPASPPHAVDVSGDAMPDTADPLVMMSDRFTVMKPLDPTAVRRAVSPGKARTAPRGGVVLSFE